MSNEADAFGLFYPQTIGNNEHEGNEHEGNDINQSNYY